MSELSYLPATEQDIPVIFSLCKDLIDAYEDVGSIDYDRVLAWVGEKLRKNIIQYTCVYQGDNKVGYFCFAKQNDGWEIDDLYVLPEYRNRGIGTEILKHCLQIADSSVFLYVFTGNTGAIRLYERMGFITKCNVGNTRMIMHRNG